MADDHAGRQSQNCGVPNKNTPNSTGISTFSGLFPRKWESMGMGTYLPNDNITINIVETVLIGLDNK